MRRHKPRGADAALLGSRKRLKKYLATENKKIAINYNIVMLLTSTLHTTYVVSQTIVE